MNVNCDYPASDTNYSLRTSGKIKYIVIHYVGAAGSAADNARYFHLHEYLGSSAHYFVGNKSEGGRIYKSVDPKYRAWHCGTNGTYRHPECRNENSIGVELCCKKVNGEWIFEDETVTSAVCLVRELMKIYGVSPENVIRHYDVTGKVCPAPFVYDENRWQSFKRRIAMEEYTTPNDIVWELKVRGIVTDGDGMLAEMEQNPNGRLYWICRKAVTYIREREW